MIETQRDFDDSVSEVQFLQSFIHHISDMDLFAAYNHCLIIFPFQSPTIHKQRLTWSTEIAQLYDKSSHNNWIMVFYEYNLSYTCAK